MTMSDELFLRVPATVQPLNDITELLDAANACVLILPETASWVPYAVAWAQGKGLEVSYNTPATLHQLQTMAPVALVLDTAHFAALRNMLASLSAARLSCMVVCVADGNTTDPTGVNAFILGADALLNSQDLNSTSLEKVWMNWQAMCATLGLESRG